MRSAPSGAKPAATASRATEAGPAPARAAQAKPKRRLHAGLFAGSSGTGVVLPGAESAAPARPDSGENGRMGRKAEIDPVVAALNRPRVVRRTGTPLQGFHRALAAPVAKLVGVLGFAPGQLSIQSLTVTILAIVTLADGTFTHVVAGAAMIYAALLLDRADALLGERKGLPGPWTAFLGVVADRLVELSVLIGLGLLAVGGVEHPLPPWIALPANWLPVLVVAAAATWLVRITVDQMAETLLLRTHLLSTRRLPGPMAVARLGPVRPVLGSLFGRDETIAACAVGIALGQVAVTAIALAAAQGLALIEAVVVFHMRLREPEIEASRLLGPDFP